MSIDTLEQEIEELQNKLKPLIELKAKRMRQLDKEKSKQFIQLNKITKDSVQDCDEDGLPYFGMISTFANWLRVNSDKSWCSWNGIIYSANEIVSGRMDRDAVGRYEDVPAV